MTRRNNRARDDTVATVAATVAPERRRDGASWNHDARDDDGDLYPQPRQRRPRRSRRRETVTLRNWQEVAE